MTTEAKKADKQAETFGANNMAITEEADKVTIQFDPARIIGEFKSGNPRVCSTGSYRTLDASGVKIMLHVIGRSDG